MRKKLIGAATVAVIATSLSGKAASASTHEVKSGDSLWTVANKYNTTIARLKELNELASDIIYPKQVLKVEQLTSNSSASKNDSTFEQRTNYPSENTYTVKPGDFLTRIANMHHITLNQLKSWNGLTSDLILPGQVLKVSVDRNNNKTQSTEQTKNTQPSRGSSSGANHTYTVVSGDTLGKIAATFHTTVNNLKQLNGLSSDLIRVGQKIRVNGQAVSEVSKQTTSSSSPTVSSSSGSLIDAAKNVIGTKYVWGGTTPAGFDCSGFIYYAFNQSGQNISRLSTDGYFNRSYYVNDPQPGDLIFFRNTYRKGISHMGIYLGNNQFIHAGSSSGVTISSVNNTYWKSKLDGYKRFY